MNITERSKFWLIFTLIVVAGFIGGILGNWLFIYLLDKYYDIPAGNYLAAPVTGDVIVRDSKPSASTNDFTQAVKSADTSLVGLFRYDAAKPETENFLPNNRVGQAAVLTSDGWIVTVTKFSPEAPLASFRVVTNDRKAYAIDKIVYDAPTQLSFLHLAQAQSLSVKEILMSRDLNPGQSIVGIEWDGAVEEGKLARFGEGIRISDTATMPLAVSGLGDRNLFLFDNAGRMAGLTQGRNAVAMDTIKILIDKLLTSNSIARASLGVRYINLSNLPVATGNGALLTADGTAPAVETGSAAQKAGLRAGDIITTFDGVEVGSFSSLALLVQEYEPGDVVPVGYTRGGKPATVSVTLGRLTSK